MPHLKEITVPEYDRNLITWERMKTMHLGGDTLIAQMRPLPEETATAVTNRQSLAIDFADISGEIQRQIDILTLSGLSIEVEDNEKLSAVFAADDGRGVDGQGSTLIHFMLNDILSPALTYGRCYPIVDRTFLTPGLTEFQAEQMENPYGYVLNPLEVPAWQWTSTLKTEFKSVITKTHEMTHKDIDGFADGEEDFFTQWTWEMTLKENEKGDQIAAVPNLIKKVPILVFDLRQSFLKNLWNPVMAMLEHFSLASIGGASQIYGMPIVFSDAAATTIDAGFNKALSLPEKARFEIHNTPVEGIKYNAEFAEIIKDHINKLLKNSMRSMTVGGVQQSGISKKMDQIGQEQFSHFLAHEIERFAPRLVNLFALYLTPDKLENKVITNIPEQFVMRDREEDRKDAEFLSTKFKPTTDAQLRAATQTIRELTGIEENMTAEEIRKDNDEIDSLTLESPGSQSPSPAATGQGTP